MVKRTDLPKWCKQPNSMLANDRDTLALKNKQNELGSADTIATIMLNNSLILLLSTVDTFLTTLVLFDGSEDSDCLICGTHWTPIMLLKLLTCLIGSNLMIVSRPNNVT